MDWVQKEIQLSPKLRGFHLITDELLRELPELGRFSLGLAHIFIGHTSASLTINENADPDVRADLESHFNALVPEDAPHYRHTLEGPDDITAHIKAVIIGPSVTVPIHKGRFRLGTWQGIYLCEHREQGGPRRLIVTLQGQRG